jgi:hypothetical protein
MRICVNTSEAEVMVALLAAVEDGVVEWVGSEYLDFDVGQDPDGERVRRVGSLLALVGARRVDARLNEAPEITVALVSRRRADPGHPPPRGT